MNHKRTEVPGLWTERKEGPSSLLPQSAALSPQSFRVRRGSVLLIVVVLLLVLAILGMAYLATTRVDRLTSSQDVVNSQIDSLTAGVRDMANSAIVNSLFSLSYYNATSAPQTAIPSQYQYQFRGTIAQPTAAPSTFVPGETGVLAANNYDIPDYQQTYSTTQQGDPWLADRVPTLVGLTPTWMAITAPLITSPINGTGVFESPLPPVTLSNGVLAPTMLNHPPFTYSAYANLQPTFMVGVLQAKPTQTVTGVYPAFTTKVTDGLGASLPNLTIVAGDAEGTGIADCGLFRLPGVYADGLTYYAGVRIIDNNSAINVNTAWDNQYDYSRNGIQSVPSSGTLFPSFFPSSVGLNELLPSGDQTYGPPLAALPQPQYLNDFRFGGIFPPPANGTGALAVDDNGKSHKDVNFPNLTDAMYHQLSRRLANPGYVNTLGNRYRAIGDADAAALAYHGCLINPSAYPGLANGSVSPMTLVEQLLYNSTFRNAPNSNFLRILGLITPIPALSPGWTAYPSPSLPTPTFVASSFNNDAVAIAKQWYNDNYATTTNLRPLLTTRNGVSIAAPMNSASVVSTATPQPTVPNAAMLPYGDRGRWNANMIYSPGDCITYATGSTASPPSAYVFSGVYFAKQASGPGTAVGAVAPTGVYPDPNWSRPTYWPYRQAGQTKYSFLDYVYVDNYTNNQTPAPNPQLQAFDEFHFYRAVTASPTTPPTLTSADWAVWTPSAAPMAMKANINTALFPELFRAFWNVMAATNSTGTWGTPFDVPTTPATVVNASNVPDIYAGSHFSSAPNGISTPITTLLPASATNTTFHPEQMFRSPFRDNPSRPNYAKTVTYFEPSQVLLLRAAIAAVNTENLRSTDPNGGLRTVIARQIPLNLTKLNTGANTKSYVPVSVDIYGNQPQPYITEVYAQTDITNQGGSTNLSGYFAVELYNPYSFPIPLVPSGVGGTGNDYAWQIATVNRNAGNILKTVTPIVTFDPTNYPPAGGTNGLPIVPAGGYLLLENYGPGGSGTATYRPAASGLPQTGPITGVNSPTAGVNPRAPLPPLNTLYVKNLGSVIGQEMLILKRRNPTGSPSSGIDGNYTWNDSPAGGNVNAVYDYVPVDSFDFSGLPLGTATNAYALHYARSTSNWGFVYPGRYDASGLSGSNPQEGTQYENWNPTPPATDPWAGNPPTPGMTLGALNGASVATTNANPTASYGTKVPIPVQLSYPSSPNWAGPGKPTAAGPNNYPFGGFARNGDILEVPYIASYEVRDATSPNTIYEINAVTMDAAFAEDTDTMDDSIEQIGRFCPMIPTPNAGVIDDTQRTGTKVRYGWAQSLFDYLTVQDPRDDYLPNIDPSVYPMTGAPVGTLAPVPVANSDASVAANTDAENTQSVQGLVNINTAPLQVLESLPLAVTTGGTVDTTGTAALANAIINYRQTNGPFKSIFELNAILAGSAKNFQNGNGDMATGGYVGDGVNSSTAGQGNLTPTSGINNQFDELYLQINRLSNLITTRSDSFTVYVVVEGWLNAGTISAQLITTRRAAYIVDRTSVTPLSRAVRTVTVPNN